VTQTPCSPAPFIIALDGVAASGKGTLARKIAAHYHFPYLDTGLSYRAVAHALLQGQRSLDDMAYAVCLARALDLSCLDGVLLSRHEIGEAASKIAQNPALRAVLVEKQRHFAQHPPGNAPGAVLDGRDIGSIVAPHAAVKFYITASLEIRAQRRYEEVIARGGQGIFSAILADLRARDARDSQREASPLQHLPDAHLLDTSKLSIEAAFAFCLKIIEEKWQIWS